MRTLTLTPNIVRRDPTFQEVKDHMEKKGLRPLREEEVKEKDPMLIFLGGSRPMWHRGGLDWDQIAFTTGFHYPVE